MALVNWKTIEALSIFYQNGYDLLRDLIETDYQCTFWLAESGATWIRAIQLWETQSALLMQAKIPKICAEQLEIQVSEETISLQKIYRQPWEIEEDSQGEWASNRCKSLIPLPCRIQPQTAIAHWEGSTLMLTLQKAAIPSHPIKVVIQQSTRSVPKNSLLITTRR